MEKRDRETSAKLLRYRLASKDKGFFKQFGWVEEGLGTPEHEMFRKVLDRSLLDILTFTSNGNQKRKEALDWMCHEAFDITCDRAGLDPGFVLSMFKSVCSVYDNSTDRPKNWKKPVIAFTSVGDLSEEDHDEIS